MTHRGTCYVSMKSSTEFMLNRRTKLLTAQRLTSRFHVIYDLRSLCTWLWIQF
jgi:hypothetical protein